MLTLFRVELLESVFTVFVSYCERKPADSHNTEPRVPNVVTVLKLVAARKNAGKYGKICIAKTRFIRSCWGTAVRCYLVVRVSQQQPGAKVDISVLPVCYFEAQAINTALSVHVGLIVIWLSISCLSPVGLFLCGLIRCRPVNDILRAENKFMLFSDKGWKWRRADGVLYIAKINRAEVNISWTSHVINWVFLNPPGAVEASVGPTVLCPLPDLVRYVCVFIFFIASGFAQNIFDGLCAMCSFDIVILSKCRTGLMYAALGANW